MTSEKETHKLKMQISQFLRLRKIVLEKAERFGVKFALVCEIESNYMIVDLDILGISIDYFRYNDVECYDDCDEKIESIVIPYEALCDKDVWIQKILTDRKKSVKSEELIELEDELNSLKEDRDLTKKKSQSLEEECNKLERKIKNLSKE